MSWRFRQSFKLIPGVKLNLAKTGLSLSFGGAPLTLNVGRRGVYGTASIPGSLMVQNGNHVDREAVLQEMEWLQTMLGDFPGMIAELERVLNVSAPESFGPPGQPGDVEKIIAAANEFADVYEKMLNWMHRVHRATFNGPIAKVAVALERSLKPMMQTVQRFPQRSLQKLESALAQHKQSGAPIKLEMCLNLNVGDMSSVSRAMEQVTRELQ